MSNVVPTACFGVEPIITMEKAFRFASVISQTVLDMESSQNQLLILLDMVREYCILLNGQDVARPLVFDSMMRFGASLEVIHEYILDYCTSSVLNKLWKARPFNRKVESFIQQLERNCRNIIIPSEQRAAVYLAKLPSQRELDGRQLCAKLKAALGGDNSEHILTDFLKTNSITEMEAMDTLRSMLSLQDAATRDQLTKIMSMVQQRLGKRMPLKPWRIKRDEVEVGRLLGDSAISTVNVAVWRGDTVAIKIFDLAASFGAFHEQVAIWTNLHHPNILEVFGASQNETPCFTIMPFCQHGNLITYLSKEGPRNVKKLELAQDIAAGLSYLHSRHIVHGELKASAIIVDDNLKAKIGNYGLTPIKMRSLVSDGTLYSPSPRWMSPEHISRGMISKQGDIYSLGVTFWELFTVRKPYLGQSESGAKRCVLSGQLLDLDMANAQIPASLHALFTKCWAMEPTARPTAADVVEILSSFTLTPNEVSGLLDTKSDSPEVVADLAQFSNAYNTLIDLHEHAGDKYHLESLKMLLKAKAGSLADPS